MGSNWNQIMVLLASEALPKHRVPGRVPLIICSLPNQICELSHFSGYRMHQARTDNNNNIYYNNDGDGIPKMYCTVLFD